MVDEPVSGKTAFASLSTPTTFTLRSGTPSAAFCAAHETHLAGVTDGVGARAPPRVYRDSRPRPSQRGAHAPVSVSHRPSSQLAIRIAMMRRVGAHGTISRRTRLPDVRAKHAPAERPFEGAIGRIVRQTGCVMTPISEQDISDAYTYLLGRLLVTRQQRSISVKASSGTSS